MNSPNVIIGVQKRYIQMLKEHFQELWQRFDPSRESPREFLRIHYASLRSPLKVPYKLGDISLLSFQAEKLLDDVLTFWNREAKDFGLAIYESERVSIQLGDANAVTEYYAASIKRLGIYFDTVCVLDPFYIMAKRREVDYPFFNGGDNDVQLVRLLTSFLDLITLMPLISSETDAPIVVVVPGVGMNWEGHEFDEMKNTAQKQALRIYAEAFDANISSFNEALSVAENMNLKKFYRRLDANPTIHNICEDMGLASIVKLVNDSAVTESLPLKRKKLLRRASKTTLSLIHLNGTLQGAFLALAKAEASAGKMGMELALPAEQWTLNSYRLKADEQSIRDMGINIERPIQAALLSDKMRWLEATTIGDLRKIREQGTLEELRDCFRVRAAVLRKSKPHDLEIAVGEVINGISETLKESVRKADELEASQQRDRNSLLVRFGIATVLGVASTVLSLPISAIPAAIAVLVPGASAWDFLSQSRKHKEEGSRLMRSPGMFMLGISERARS